MKISEPSVELINAPDYKTLLTTIEAAGRTCYKSEDKITDGSAEQICSRGTQTASKLFPDFPICIDGKFYFAGTSTKPKSSKSKTPCGG